MNADLTEPGWADIRSLHRADEADALRPLVAAAAFSAAEEARILARARRLLESLKGAALEGDLLERFQQEYQISNQEGLALMRLAEALLRIPDSHTADALVRDNIAPGDWKTHRGKSPSLLVNIATFSLEKFAALLASPGDGAALRALAGRLGLPVARTALHVVLGLMGQRYVFAGSIEDGLARAARSAHFSHSFDMLGESARTAADARRYLDSYAKAVEAVGAAQAKLPRAATVSIKLSALHPRYEVAQEARAERELAGTLRDLLTMARARDVGITIDAEEADRLELSLRIFQSLARDPKVRGWDGLGLAVQAYQKRAPAVIGWIEDLGAAAGSRFDVRLVKGAYWDAEIKRCQERGLVDYPVFTRKAATDVSYLACARKMLASGHIHSAFATHNTRTVASIVELAGPRRDFEFQKLQGMGEGLYERLFAEDSTYACRLYAPVGPQRELLSYLVRRLLENGANTSFLKQALDGNEDGALADPVAQMRERNLARHPAIPLPRDLFGEGRSNSMGIDLSDVQVLSRLAGDFEAHWSRGWTAASLVAGTPATGPVTEVRDPADIKRVVGTAVLATPEDIAAALGRADKAAPRWAQTPVEERAACLRRAADMLEAQRTELMALCVREAGKTIPDAVAEIREAVDFCRYYAAQASADFAPVRLPGPTGETNELRLAGRGVFVCISPWNFPLAIFSGQIAAALVAGNAVIAKPAPQTPLIAYRAVQIFHAAGVPEDVLQLVLGGADAGRHLVASPVTAGVAFTGSNAAARAIQGALIARENTAIAPLIAETGGVNAMIADSSALPEQLVADVIASGYQSAGQRCSALRLLFLQEDTAAHVIEMLTGAMDELVIGDPAQIATDVGPVIDRQARDRLAAHVKAGKFDLIHAGRLTPAHDDGWFFAPHLLRVGETPLEHEVFGPIIHVALWRKGELERVIETINRPGYGLTMGLHSRVASTVEQVRKLARVGNLYVNRTMIGAVVGSQPFGGEGLSGTGPKAGGPRYLARFATERAVSIDTTAAGGNAALLTAFDDHAA